jgi:hypothetical protein
VEVRHQTRLAGDQFKQRLIDLDAVERRQAKATERRDCSQELLAQKSQTHAFMIVARDVDAGEGDFLRASRQLSFNGFADRLEGKRLAGPACLPDGAEGAAMVAPVLNGNEASHMAEESRRNHLVRPERSAQRVVEGRWHRPLTSPFDFAQDERWFGECMELFGITNDTLDFGHCLKRLRVQLRSAAGDENAGIRTRAIQSADRLSRLPHGLIGHRAAVDDDPLLIGGCKASDRLALGEIQTAAERDRLDAHASVSRSISPLKT